MTIIHNMKTLARLVSQLMAKWDGPKVAADLLLERYGN
jgi:hypothetical protein